MASLVLMLGLLAQIVAPGEMQCLGFIFSPPLPQEIYVAGVEEEGVFTLATQGMLIYLNGPGIPTLAPGEVQWVVRPEGKIRDPLTGKFIGYYYKELGSVRIEAVDGDVASATVVQSCGAIHKGDLLWPETNRKPVTFSGKMSDQLTTYPDQALTTSIVLGKDDIQELTAGNICFIGAGWRDGVQLGDRFTVYRVQPPFNPQDLIVEGRGREFSYKRMSTDKSRGAMSESLSSRKLPMRVVGDLVVVDLGEFTATAKIVNSRFAIHVGDLVARR